MSDLKNEHIIVGYSGHGFVVAEAAMEMGINLVGYTESAEKSLNPYGLKFLGDEREKGFLENHENTIFILGIGDNRIRMKAFDALQKVRANIRTVIHPETKISKSAVIERGAFISTGAIINPLVKIGEGVIVNTGAVIEHECIVKCGAHIAPNATLAGNVIIGANSFVGAGAVVKQNLVIGDNVVIGAGSVVLKNVSDNSVIAGNPAKNI